MFGQSEKPEHEYYSRHQAIAGVFITIFYCLLFFSGVFEASLLELRIFAGLNTIAFGLVGFRLIRARVAVFEWGIRVHNVFSTFELPWQDIARFEMGSAGLLPYVCLIHLRDGGRKQATGIQERTNFPSGSAEELAEELNAELAKRTGGAALPTAGVS
ncbi:MAG: PH domain-containing protein [Actinomycetota bacterium]|nr:PH domain-containing protein [Actinomycetota bacterium]